MANFLNNHEMLGDSQFVRLISQINKLKPTKNAEGCNHFGHCISGQNIHKLKRRLKFTASETHKKILIMVGTNDVRRGTPVRKFKIIYRDILKLLKGKEVVVLTIPPLPLYGNHSQQYIRWKAYNSNIKKLEGCRILDTVPLFHDNGKILDIYFEKYYGYSGRKDGVHLNTAGLKCLQDFLNLNLDPVENPRRTGQLSLKKGNLFDAPHDHSLAHCVAEDIIMGAGIAKKFRAQFGRVGYLLSQNQTAGGLATLYDKSRYIYYLVTKEQSRGKPTYDTLWQSLNKLKDHMKRYNVTKLALPQIGCGLNRLEWDIVRQMIEHVFRDAEVEIVVYII